MSADQPLQPRYGSGKVVTGAAATAATTALAPGTKQALVTNVGAALGYFIIGKTGMAVASNLMCPIPAGAGIVVTKAEDDDLFGYFSTAGTDFHIIPCEGE